MRTPLLLILLAAALPLTARAADPATTPADTRDWRYTLTIHEIARADDDARLAQLVTDNPDRVLLRLPDGATPALVAAQAGALKSLRVLAKAGADLNLPDDKGHTPLAIAIGMHFTTTVKTLIELGVDVNHEGVADDAPMPPLNIAMKRGYADIVAALLDAKANLDQIAFDGSTPLTAGAANGHMDAVKFLLSHGAQPDAPNKSGDTALMLAVRSGYADAVAVLLDAKADANFAAPDGTTPLLAAAAGNHAPILTALLTHGAKPDTVSRDPGDTALMLAVRQGYPDVVTVLLDAKADPNFTAPDGTTPLLAAAAGNHADILAALLAHGAKTDAVSRDAGDTALMLAVRRSYANIAAVLLDAKANPNFTAPDGTTPLLVAAAGKHWDILTALLNHGANPNAQDTAGVTALISATAAENEPAVRLLLEKGADPKLADKTHRTPLALTKSPALWKLLVSKGADVNATVQGATPLQYFIQNGNLTLVKAWLEYKPDPLLPDRKGLTAKELAKSYAGDAITGDRREIARLLETYQNDYFAQHETAPATTPGK